MGAWREGRGLRGWAPGREGGAERARGCCCCASRLAGARAAGLALGWLTGRVAFTATDRGGWDRGLRWRAGLGAAGSVGSVAGA